MDNFLTNRRSLSNSGDRSISPDVTSGGVESAFKSLNEENQVLLEGDGDLPRVETILENSSVRKIVITMPDGKRLELDCIY